MTEKVPKRRSSTKARRNELVQIAYRLIAEKGLEGLRTRDVAAAAGIDTGTLHYHFPSKEALEQAVVEYLAEDFSTDRIAAGKVPANALEELHNEIFDAALRVRQSPDQLLVMLDLTVRASRDPAVAEILKRMYEGWTCSITRMLRAGIEQGLIRADINPETVTPLLRAQLIGLGVIGLAQPDRVEAVAAALYSQLETWLSKPTM
jgi:AcrR family transcriptional regulator